MLKLFYLIVRVCQISREVLNRFYLLQISIFEFSVAGLQRFYLHCIFLWVALINFILQFAYILNQPDIPILKIIDAALHILKLPFSVRNNLSCSLQLFFHLAISSQSTSPLFAQHPNLLALQQIRPILIFQLFLAFLQFTIQLPHIILLH